MKKAKVFEAWHKLDNAEDLRREKLSPCDYQTLTYCLKELFSTGETKTLQKNVADWCSKQGLNVMLNDGINYTIKF